MNSSTDVVLDDRVNQPYPQNQKPESCIQKQPLTISSILERNSRNAGPAAAFRSNRTKRPKRNSSTTLAAPATPSVETPPSAHRGESRSRASAEETSRYPRQRQNRVWGQCVGQKAKRKVRKASQPLLPSVHLASRCTGSRADD